MRSSYSTIAGTRSFIAPEVWKIRDTNQRYTKTADIYSYGIVLYCLLNDNMLPLVNTTSSQNDIEMAVDARLSGQTFPPPKNGSNKLKSIVMKCCEYRPEDRFQSIDEVLSALKDQSFRIAPKPAAASVPVQDSFATMYAGDTFNNQTMGSNYQTPIQPPPQPMQYSQPQNFQQNSGYGAPYAYQQQPMQQQFPQQGYGNQDGYGYNSFHRDKNDEPAPAKTGKSIGAILVTIIICTLVLVIMVLLVFLKIFSKEQTTGDPELTTRTPVTVSVDSEQAPETTETTETAEEPEETEETDETDATVATLPDRVKPESAEFSGYVYVLADLKYTGLIIRKGPSTKYDVEYDSIPRGYRAEKYAETVDKKTKEKWTYVRYEDEFGVEHYGWVYSDYVSSSPTLVIPDEPLGVGTTMRVATMTDPLSLRAGPANDYNSFKSIPRGKLVTMYLSKYNSTEKLTYAFICYDTYFGWVQMQFLADPDKPLPTETTTTKTKPKTTTTTKEPEDDSDGEYCGLPVASVKASSYLPSETTGGKSISYDPENVVDGKYKTAWVENDSGDGIGEWIELELEHEEMISEIYIANGYQSSEKSFNLNNRVKKLRLDFSDGSSYEFTLSGKYSDQPESIELPDSVTASSVRITILSVYSGTKYNDTCISEIEVY